MACMDHDCRDCEHMWADNKRASECPRCGSTNVTNFWDEEFSDLAEEYEEEYEDEDNGC